MSGAAAKAKQAAKDKKKRTKAYVVFYSKLRDFDFAPVSLFGYRSCMGPLTNL